jgi:hypothetical protein
MSTHHGIYIKCKRVTKQGIPCRNRAVRGADYCFLHNVSERRGWAFYLGLIGSIASIAGLAFFFLPPTQPHSEKGSEPHLEKVNGPPRIPFYMTNINDDTFFSVRGAFQGEFQILPESVELNIKETDIDYPIKYSLLGKRQLTAISAGLCISTNTGEWTITHSDTIRVNILVSPGDHIKLKTLHFSILKNSVTDVSRSHIVMQLVEDLPDGRKGYFNVHSDPDIFSR